MATQRRSANDGIIAVLSLLLRNRFLSDPQKRRASSVTTTESEVTFELIAKIRLKFSNDIIIMYREICLSFHANVLNYLKFISLALISYYCFFLYFNIDDSSVLCYFYSAVTETHLDLTFRRYNDLQRYFGS